MNALKTILRQASTGTFSAVWVCLTAISACLLLAIGFWFVGLSYFSDTAEYTSESIGETQNESDNDQNPVNKNPDSPAEPNSSNSVAEDVEEPAVDTTGAENRVNTSQLPDSSFIYDISIEELEKAEPYLDNQTVQVTGEVVGDRVIAEENRKHCWITLQSINDTDSEISVFMTRKATKAIDVYGSYGKRGTVLQVRGIFHLASKDHQGTSELEAQNVAIVSPGSDIEHPFNATSLVPGLFLMLIGSCFMLVFNVFRERQR